MKQINRSFRLRILFLYALAFIFSNPVFSQDQEKNEVSVFIGGGFSTLKYDLPAGKYDRGYGGTAGLGYGYFFNDQVGISTGIEIARYSSKSSVPQFSGNYMTNDGEENFDFRYRVNNYTENQSLWTINIPVMFQFQYPVFFDEHLCYLALGGRVGFPISSTYESAASSYATSGYYSQYDVLLTSPQSQGFGVFENQKFKDDLDFQIAFMLSAEAGMKWMIADELSLYTGVYCDYGLNDLSAKETDRNFLIYNASQPANFINNSILYSKYSENEVSNKFTSKVTPMALGIKIRFTFRIPEASCF